MDTEELTTLLRHVTEDVAPRTGFTDTVLRGGRRRRTRHRIAVVTAAVAAIALVGGSYAVVSNDGAATQVADARLSEPTKGPLAGDEEFVEQALAAWRAGLAQAPDADRHVYDDLRGEPHVYWAGETPAGRAAVVLQQVFVHQNDQLHNHAEGLRTAEGLVAVDVADGKLKLVSDQWDLLEQPEPQPRRVYRFGPGDRTVLVAYPAKPVFISPEPLVRDRKAVRDWQQVPVEDGVAITQLPEDVDSDDPIVLERDTQPAPEELDRAIGFLFSAASDYLAMTQDRRVLPMNGPEPTGLRWSNVSLSVGSAGGPQFDVHRTYGNEVADKFTSSASGGYSNVWHIRAGLADGRVAVLSDVQSGSEPARFYAMLVNPDMSTEVYRGEEVDANAVLPVRYRLPDGQGWIVAQNGQPLQYRTTTDGAWQDAGQSAALVPDETVQVKVGDQVVTLPG